MDQSDQSDDELTMNVDPIVSNTPTLYSLIFEVKLNEFVNSKSGTSLPKANMKVNTIAEFREQVYEKYKVYLKREVIIVPLAEVTEDNPEYSYAQTQSPTINDLNRFCSFQDTASKRKSSLIDVSHQLLTTDQSLSCFQMGKKTRSS